MCGICAIITKCGAGYRNENLPNLLIRRGPDGFGEISFSTGTFNVKIFASVLCCRSTHCSQPIVDQSSGNILAWNGEIFGGLEVADKGNDGLALSDLLSDSSTIDQVVSIFTKIEGPYSFIYWHKSLTHLFFGRDVLGRRSLLVSPSSDQANFVISSVLPRCDCLGTSEELIPTGIFSFNLRENTDFCENVEMFTYEWPEKCSLTGQMPKIFKNTLSKTIPNPLFCRESITKMLPSEEDDEKLKKIASLVQSDQITDALMVEIFEKSISQLPELEGLLLEFIETLKASVEKRCKAVPQFCLACAPCKEMCQHCKIGVLFSGGLDSTILAALVDEFLPESEAQVDLLNVAFYQAKNKGGPTPPDRQTALTVVELLDQTGENSRKFELKCVDISQDELQTLRRDRIRELILPCDTILDDSLGCALWFATNCSQCPAKILIHGLGADELFGGYSRHRACFQNGGWGAVEACLLSDLGNLPHRNLGRDDRVASDNSRELRHPFLDENVVKFVTSRVPVFLRLNPYLPRSIGDKLFLRFVALELAEKSSRKWRESLLKAAGFPKRAIQFGSRIANIEKETVRATTSGRRINASDISKKLLEN